MQDKVKVGSNKSKSLGIIDSLGFLAVPAAGAKQTADKLTNALDGFADAFARFNHAFLNSFRNPKTVKRTVGSRGSAGDKDFFERIYAGWIGQKQTLRIDAGHL